MMFITSPRNHALLQQGLGLRRTPFQLKFQSKFATPMSIYINYRSAPTQTDITNHCPHNAVIAIA
jgi:hypothetical protein